MLSVIMLSVIMLSVVAPNAANLIYLQSETLVLPIKYYFFVLKTLSMISVAP